MTNHPSMTVRYTLAEQRQRAALLLRGSRQALAAGDVDERIDRRIEAIDQAAADRWRREATAALALLDQAKTAAATARAAEKAADRRGRPAAKRARQQAEDALRRAQKAARKYT